MGGAPAERTARDEPVSPRSKRIYALAFVMVASVFSIAIGSNLTSDDPATAASQPSRLAENVFPPRIPKAPSYSIPSPLAEIFDEPLRDYDARIFASAAGVYRTEELRNEHGWKNTVLLTSSNFGMKDFLENWMCHAKRLNYKFLVHSLDRELHDELTARGIPSMMVHEASSEFVKWSETSYHNVVKAKLDVVMLTLRHGYDVLFSDIDIGFLNDPFPLFRRDCDWEFQVQAFHANAKKDRSEHGEIPINSGFYYAKSNTRSLTLLGTVMVDRATKGGNQRIFNTAIKASSIRTLLPDEEKQRESDIRLLDPHRVVVGNPFVDDSEEYLSDMTRSNISLADIGVVHANWVVGEEKKHQILKHTGTWLYKGDDVCEPFSLDDAAEMTREWLSREQPREWG